jgi:hypothetical protein
MARQERGSVTAGRQLLFYAALPIAYVVAGRLGLLLAVPPGYPTALTREIEKAMAKAAAGVMSQ